MRLLVYHSDEPSANALADLLARIADTIDEDSDVEFVSSVDCFAQRLVSTMSNQSTEDTYDLVVAYLSDLSAAYAREIRERGPAVILTTLRWSVHDGVLYDDASCVHEYKLMEDIVSRRHEDAVPLVRHKADFFYPVNREIRAQAFL